MTDSAKIKELGFRLGSLELCRHAALSQYTAAGMMGSESERDALRNDLHTLLDLHLDALDEVAQQARL